MAKKSVKVVSPTSDKMRATLNRNSTIDVNQAKSGKTAQAYMDFMNQLTYGDKVTGNNGNTIKVNSAKVTPQGTQVKPALRVRTTGGLGGGGTLRDMMR